MCVSCITHGPTDMRLGAVLHLASRVVVRCSCLRWRCDEHDGLRCRRAFTSTALIGHASRHISQA